MCGQPWRHLEFSASLAAAVKSGGQRAAEMDDLLKAFVCVIPKVALSHSNCLQLVQINIVLTFCRVRYDC